MMTMQMFKAAIRVGKILTAAASILVLPDRSLAGEGHWTPQSATALIQYVNDIDRHGLDHTRYPVADLASAVERGDVVAIELAASDLFTRLALDLSEGSAPAEQRRAWRIDKIEPGEEAMRSALDASLQSGRPDASLESLAPPHAAYRALMAALASAPDNEKYKQILRVNMERWRWMPRDLGPDYVLVNIPAYEAIVVRGGAEIGRYRVIVGARKTPTPRFSALAAGVTINPTWYVPQSIVVESVGALLKSKPKEAARLGYYVADDGGVRQKPGPANALGRLKLAMQNPYSVYIHDTPDRKIFDREVRALSHGCIRINDAEAFAAHLLGDPWDSEMIDRVIDAGATMTIELQSPIPIYVAYFTAAARGNGEIALYPDIYALDGKMLTGSKAASHSTPEAPISGNCPPEIGG